MAKRLEGDIPEQESRKRLKIDYSSADVSGSAPATVTAQLNQSDEVIANSAPPLPGYITPSLQFFPSLSSLSSNSIATQTHFHFDVKLPLHDLGFRQENISSMITLQNISSAIVCMETLTRPTNLMTLQAIITELNFDPSQVSNMLYHGYTRINQLNFCLGNIRVLVNNAVPTQDITNILCQYHRRKSEGFEAGIERLANKYGIALENFISELTSKPLSSDLPISQKASHYPDFVLKIELIELGFTKKNICSMLSNKRIGSVGFCMDTLTTSSSLKTLETMIKVFLFPPTKVSSMLHSGYSRIKQLNECIENIGILVKNKIEINDITRVLVRYSAQDSGGFEAGVKELAAQYNIELQDIKYETDIESLSCLLPPKSISPIIEKDAEVETALKEGDEAVRVAKNLGILNAPVIESIPATSSPSSHFFGAPQAPIVELPPSLTTDIPHVLYLESATASSTIVEPQDPLERESESLISSSVIIDDRKNLVRDEATCDIVNTQSDEDDVDEYDMARWGAISSLNILHVSSCQIYSPQSKDGNGAQECLDECNEQPMLGSYFPAHNPIKFDEEFSLYTSDPLMSFGECGELGGGKIIFEEIPIMSHR